MAEIITFKRKLFRKHVEREIRAGFIEKYAGKNVFGNLILHENPRIYVSIKVRRDRIRVRAGQRLGDFLVLVFGGSMAQTPMAVGAFDEIRRSIKETEQKYSSWIREKFEVP